MTLVSGSYVERPTLRVVVWPAPSVDGDGKEVWVDKVDLQGRNVGRSKATENGLPIKHHSAPEGFQNLPGYDHSDNYVLTDERGDVVRQPNGDAIRIQPGEAVVFYPDGSTKVLVDEYEQYVFHNSHDVADAVEPNSASDDEGFSA